MQRRCFAAVFSPASGVQRTPSPLLLVGSLSALFAGSRSLSPEEQYYVSFHWEREPVPFARGVIFRELAPLRDADLDSELYFNSDLPPAVIPLQAEQSALDDGIAPSSGYRLPSAIWFPQ